MFETKQLPIGCDVVAPDGSDVRLLLGLRGGGMAHFTLAAGQVSIQFGLKGPNFATVSACASGAHAIGEALRLLRAGDADVILAGGSEATITPMALAGFGIVGRNGSASRQTQPTCCVSETPSMSRTSIGTAMCWYSTCPAPMSMAIISTPYLVRP